MEGWGPMGRATPPYSTLLHLSLHKKALCSEGRRSGKWCLKDLNWKAIYSWIHELWDCQQRSHTSSEEAKAQLLRSQEPQLAWSDVIASQALRQSLHSPQGRATEVKSIPAAGPPCLRKRPNVGLQLFPGGPTLPNQDWGNQLGVHKLPPWSTLKPFEELIKQVNDINTIVEGILNYLFKWRLLFF